MIEFNEGGEIKQSSRDNNIYMKIYDKMKNQHKLVKKKKGLFSEEQFSVEDRNILEYFEYKSNLMTKEKHITSSNPNFYQAVTMDIDINDDKLVPPPTIIILLKHQRYDKKNRKTESVLLGRYWMSLKTVNNVMLKDKLDGSNVKLDFIFQKPTWIPMIYDKHEKIDGRILMSYSLIELNDDEHELREQFRDVIYNDEALFCDVVNQGYIREFTGDYYS